MEFGPIQREQFGDVREVKSLLEILDGVEIPIEEIDGGYAGARYHVPDGDIKDTLLRLNNASGYWYDKEQLLPVLNCRGLGSAESARKHVQELIDYSVHALRIMENKS